MGKFMHQMLNYGSLQKSMFHIMIYSLITLVLSVAGLVFTSHITLAGQESVGNTGALNLAVVDTQKVIQESTVYKSIFKQIEEKKKNVHARLQKAGSSIQSRYQELEMKKNVLSEKAQEEKMEELAQDGEVLQRTAYQELVRNQKFYS